MFYEDRSVWSVVDPDDLVATGASLYARSVRVKRAATATGGLRIGISDRKSSAHHAVNEVYFSSDHHVSSIGVEVNVHSA